MVQGDSVLFPNLFPYGGYSAVSLFDDRHFVEIGTASSEQYADCLVNCQRYLERVSCTDPAPEEFTHPSHKSTLVSVSSDRP